MILKSTKSPRRLPSEGEHFATLASVESKNEGKKIVLQFKVTSEGEEYLIPKECPASIDAGPLRKDLEIMEGRAFTQAEIDAGIEPTKWVGKPCRIVAILKAGAGGKRSPAASVVLPLPAGYPQK